jgi:hypothetical protein
MAGVEPAAFKIMDTKRHLKRRYDGGYGKFTVSQDLGAGQFAGSNIDYLPEYPLTDVLNRFGAVNYRSRIDIDIILHISIERAVG